MPVPGIWGEGTGVTANFTLRVASLDDTDAVSALLGASYPELAADYPPGVLAAALPFMTRANPRLLRSGTYYLAEAADGTLAGCGGWTLERPGAPDDPIDPALGHIRHFGTHPAWARRGIARSLLDRCIGEARAAGVKRLECYSTLGGEPFYRALGFTRVETMEVRMGEGALLPGIRMIRPIA
jgi:GNAT superfamily N-acetyltransferase